jgi:hypothetical protein
MNEKNKDLELFRLKNRRERDKKGTERRLGDRQKGNRDSRGIFLTSGFLARRGLAEGRQLPD